MPSTQPLPTPAPHAMPAHPVMGVPLALTDYERTLDWMDAAVASGHRGYGPWPASAGPAPGQRMYLYGGRTQGALTDLARQLCLRFPGLQIVGHAPVLRPLSETEQESIAAEINRAKLDVVWVGLGVPRQEQWMAQMRPRPDAAVLVGVGAAFDFHAGLVPQAPGCVQRSGIEWLFRLIQEPRRLWRRCLTHNPRFITGFARQYVRHLRASGRRG